MNESIENPQNPSVNDLAQDVRDIKQSLAEIKDHLAALPAAEPDEKKKEGRERSRGLLALAFAAIGAKLGFTLGAQAGIAKIAIKASEGKGVSEFANKALESTMEILSHHNAETIKSVSKEAAIGTAVGTLAGGWLGMARGNRIESPEKLFTDPITSIQKIFAPDDKNPDDNDKPQKAPPEGRWVHKIAKEDTEASVERK